ncbi:MAG: universal stress protein [Halobacteriota archaeon]
MVGRALVAVDGSPMSHEAFDWAVGQYGDAEIYVVNVVHPSDTSHPEGALVERHRVLVGGHGDLLDSYEAADVDVEKRLAVGRKEANAVVEAAEEIDADLVVVGSHGREGAARVLLGSVAEAVVRRSHVPVLVVR